jgi:hypothetical protein
MSSDNDTIEHSSTDERIAIRAANPGRIRDQFQALQLENASNRSQRPPALNQEHELELLVQEAEERLQQRRPLRRNAINMVDHNANDEEYGHRHQRRRLNNDIPEFVHVPNQNQGAAAADRLERPAHWGIQPAAIPFQAAHAAAQPVGARRQLIFENIPPQNNPLLGAADVRRIVSEGESECDTAPIGEHHRSRNRNSRGL